MARGPRRAHPPRLDQAKTELRRNRVFRKIEKDIKDKNRKRRAMVDASRGHVNSIYTRVSVDRRPEETYIDKDRAIAVGIGTEDLKGSLLKHRGELMRSTKEAGTEELIQNVTILIQQANHELKLGDPERALSYMLRGIQSAPDNVECRILRTRCLLGSNQSKEALEEANVLLKDYNTGGNPEVLMVKGDSLYTLGFFEHALVNYHRALAQVSSKERGKLKGRINRSELAVINAVGIANPRCFESIREHLQSLATVASQKEMSKLSKINEKHLLSELAGDKIYLENLLNQLEKNKPSPCIKMAASQARSGIEFLQERTDFWVQHTPNLEKR